MTIAVQLAASGTPVLAIFSVFVVSALLMSIWVTSDGYTPHDYFIGERRQTPITNGLAIFGTYLSAATLLGSPGLVSVYGYDGVLFLAAQIVACVIVVLLIAQPYFNLGRYTFGDTLASRLESRAVHLASGIATIVVSTVYLVVQLAGAAVLAAPILGISGTSAEQMVIASIGIMMILYVIIGGMRAATMVQVVKAVLLLGGGFTVAAAVIYHFHGNINEIIRTAEQHTTGRSFLRPGSYFGGSITKKFDGLSMELGILLGAAGLPHILMRIRTSRSAGEARQAAQWATSLSTIYLMVAGVLGFGAAAVVGREAITSDSPTGNTAVLLLAKSLGGSLMVTIVACVAFATILAVVSGLTLAAATSFAHDLYHMVHKRETVVPGRELLAARVGVVIFGLLATVLAMFVQKINISFMVSLAFTLAASAILPALLYSMYWKGFTTRGALWSIYGGLLSAIVLVVFSPGVSGNPTALLPDADFVLFPLRNPGLISIPAGFVLGWLGSRSDQVEPGGADHAHAEVRALTGVGVGTRLGDPFKDID